VAGRNVEVSIASPLKNNPRITFGADKLNFRQPGEYLVWVELRVRRPAGLAILASPKKRITIRTPKNHEEARLTRLLLARDVAFFVTQGGGPLRTQRKNQLRKAAREASSHPAVHHVRYALAKELVRWRRSPGEWLDGVKFTQASLRQGVERLKVLGKGRA
jgi:hypothetical protein